MGVKTHAGQQKLWKLLDMTDIVLRILSRNNHGHPMGTIGRASLPAADPHPPLLNDVYVFVRITKTPYPSDGRRAITVFGKPHIVPIVFGGVAFDYISPFRFRLDIAMAESATLAELTSSREVVRDWSVVRPAIIDNATAAIATDRALGVA